MGQNLELKVKVNSHESFEIILKAISADFEGLLIQKDVYYNNKNGLLKLRKQNGEYHLIQYIRNETEGERWSNFQFISICSENAESFFESILKVESVVEKTRKLYLYKGTRIHLDNVNNLGLFLELETMVNEKGEREAEDRYWEIFDLLNLGASEEIRDSYRNLIDKK